MHNQQERMRSPAMPNARRDATELCPIARNSPSKLNVARLNASQEYSMRSELSLILLVGTAAGFTATGNAPRAPVARRHLVPIVMSEEPVAAPPDRRWLRSLFLGFVAVQSSAALTYEIPGLLGPSPDYFGALIDTGFSIYAVKMLAGQAGLISDVSVDETALAALSDFECSVTLNVGREPNTWMPAEWAASGGRLSLPLKLRFSTEEVDLGVPGEEEMGGRYVRKLYW